MNRILLMIMLLVASLPATASHTWADIDLCEVYKDKLPPGLTRDALPEANSSGARLLNQYCTQCHNLPGPDRHTASEWQDVASKMFMLMDVSKRFGGLVGRVETMQSEDKQNLLAYLKRHATNSTAENQFAGNEQIEASSLTRALTLLPFLMLMGLGLLRWWSKSRNGKRLCTAD